MSNIEVRHRVVKTVRDNSVSQISVPVGTLGVVVGLAYGRHTGKLRLAVLWDGYKYVMTTNFNHVEAVQ